MKTFIFALLLTFAVSPYSYEQTTFQETRHEPILVPDAFGKLIAEHISRMYRRGYFRHLSENDFDHGHLVFRVGSPETFASLEDVLKHTALLLYHADESKIVWDSQRALAPRKRRQRSIAGFSDGRILPAIKLFSARDQEPIYYACCGTIHIVDFWLFMPKQFEQDRFIRIVSQTGTGWLVNQFVIYKTPAGRYEVGGTHYDIYFEYSD